MCSTLELEIDPVTGDAHNHPGVEIEAASFGKLHGVERACPLDVTGESDIFGRIIKYLKKQGFQEGTSLFGAPYDWRFFPLPEWIAATRKLIEDAVAKTGRRAIVVAHSLAGPYSYEMLMAQDEAWRKKYVEHWVPLAPVMTGTPIAAFMLVSKSFTNITLVIKYAEPMFMAGKNFQEHYYLAPKKNYGTGRDVFFKSDKRAYTVDDFPELMDRMAIPHGRILFKRAQEFYNKTQLRHPGIQTTAFVSHGYPTISGGVFDKDSDIGFKDPHPVFTDGDGLVTTESLTGVFKKWLADPAYASLTNITDVGKVDHKSILYLDDIKQFISNIACSSL